jgi:hypothetical protein
MTSFYVCVVYKATTLHLHVPNTWTTGRMKELILLYHSESPTIRSQSLKYRDKVLKNSDILSSIFINDSKPEVELTIEDVPEPPANFLGFKSELFKTREEEYIKKYDIARQLLLDTYHKSQDTAMIPQYSVLNTLPIIHPEVSKRIKAINHHEKVVKIRLRRLPLSIYFDFATIFRWIMFSVIFRLFLGSNIPSVYYCFIFICYVVNIRIKIENHREKELRKLPRDYLVKILPERYNVRRENVDKKGVLVVVYETARGFLASFLPWFDPVTYANQRNQAIN